MPAGASSRLEHVAIDLTPLLPEGENGGAKMVALSVVPYMGALAPQVMFTLLTNGDTHDSLAFLDAANVRRHLVLKTAAQLVGAIQPAPLPARLAGRVRARFSPAAQTYGRLSSRVGRLLSQHVHAIFGSPSTFLNGLRPDVVFCPFTAPYQQAPGVPLVSVIYDLQYLFYPQFFTPRERALRAHTFESACHFADHLLCISDFVRGTVLDSAKAEPERVQTVPLGLLQSLDELPAAEARATLERFDLRDEEFLLFPANFWAHKNHRVLLTAFGLFRARHPASSLRLVCTGAPGEAMDQMSTASRRMGLAEDVLFPGYVSTEELAALYQSCRALIFPSLYEGFGMPVLEAMAFGKPVACSDVTSLPEVAGGAALLFDPRKPEAVADAIEQLVFDPDLRARLVELGLERTRRYGSARQLAMAYLDVFREIVSSGSPRLLDGVHGVDADGWTSGRVHITYAACSHPRSLEVHLRVPPSVPMRELTLKVTESGSKRSRRHRVLRGATFQLRHDLAESGGIIDLSFTPVFIPKVLHQNEDTRELACVCERVIVIDGKQRTTLQESPRARITVA